jgi:tetratricopeptide (TPR) repeat protein
MHKPAPKTNEVSLKVKSYIEAGEKDEFSYALLVREINQLKKSDAPAAYNSLGLLERFHGNMVAAVEALKNAVNLAPNSVITNFNYAKVLLTSTNDEQAIYYAKRALDNAAFESDFSSYVYLYMMALMLRFKFDEIASFYNDKIYDGTVYTARNVSIYNNALAAIEQIKKRDIAEHEIQSFVEVFNQLLIDESLVIDDFIWQISASDDGLLIQIGIEKGIKESELMNIAFLQRFDAKGVSAYIKSFFKVDFFPLVDDVQREEPTCPMTGMTEERSEQLSAAMIEAIEKISPRKQRFVRA